MTSSLVLNGRAKVMRLAEPSKRKRPPLSVYGAPFDLAPARPCFVLLRCDALASGQPARVDVPSDWLIELVTSSKRERE